MTAKDKKQSTLQKSILAKAEKAHILVKLLEKVKARENLSPEETKKGKESCESLTWCWRGRRHLTSNQSLGNRALIYQEKHNYFAERRELIKTICVSSFKYHASICCIPIRIIFKDKPDIAAHDLMYKIRLETFDYFTNRTLTPS